MHHNKAFVHTKSRSVCLSRMDGAQVHDSGRQATVAAKSGNDLFELRESMLDGKFFSIYYIDFAHSFVQDLDSESKQLRQTLNVSINPLS